MLPMNGVWRATVVDDSNTVLHPSCVLLFMCFGLKCGCMRTQIGRVVRADPVSHWVQAPVTPHTSRSGPGAVASLSVLVSCHAHHPRSCKPAQSQPPRRLSSRARSGPRALATPGTSHEHAGRSRGRSILHEGTHKRTSSCGRTEAVRTPALLAFPSLSTPRPRL